MGQRFQIVVSTPSEYWNEKNPNNKDRQYFTYHCQWMWGGMAVEYANALVGFLKKAIAEEKKDNNKQGCPISAAGYGGFLGKSIRAANVALFPHEYRVNSYFGEGRQEQEKEDTKEITKSKDWPEFLHTLDNNNGMLFVYISYDFKISYAFWNPLGAEGSFKEFETFLSWTDYQKGYENPRAKAANLDECEVLADFFDFPQKNENKED